MQNTPISDRLRALHGAVLDIVGMMNGPARDELILREAEVRLDRALFPLLVLVERLGPIGVVELADRVGRDYTTVSRQLGKLEGQGLIARQPSATDKRVRAAVIAPPGKAMTDRIDAARDRLLRAGFADWDEQEIDALVRLMGRFADTMRAAEGGAGPHPG
ncbi:MAG TPA: MarR family winged helix-turn-helix transcriptional regulator [Sphingobium sp.]|uniref:MarR family winged helix-turn-helix transcriptional regulator n=1 Tax=Sphingobium sp. TaxID=1912891 RepID=UPI002ED33081